MKVLLALLLLSVFLFSLPLYAASDRRPPLMLAERWQPDIPIHHYWISEKLDGVRAYWGGQRLRTRAGYRLNVPDWFIAGFPSQPLDGELWLGRGRFEEVASIVQTDDPADPRWQEVRYMVFDLPAHRHNGQPALFAQRKQALDSLIRQCQIGWLAVVEHWQLADNVDLKAALAQVVKQGGEGLMLTRADRPYQAQRSDALVKLKPVYDAEAIVVGYVPGKGKYSGMTGALLVRTPEGVLFRIGSGLKDSDRQAPPPLGATVSYAFSGKTAKGKPRFPRFLHVRHGE